MSTFGLCETWEDFSFLKPSSNIQANEINSVRKENVNERAIDDGTSKPRQVVKPISSGQFAPFTNFYITVSQAHNLVDCSNQSLVLKIRVHPSIPIVETPTVWCANREADFHAAYSFDFTQIPPFNLGDFTPVLEIYKRFAKQPELLAVCLLPLKVCEVVECAGLTLTYLYRNKSIILKEIASGRRMGSLVVTVAMGFPEHEKYLDPNFQFITTPKFTPNDIVKPINTVTTAHKINCVETTHGPQITTERFHYNRGVPLARQRVDAGYVDDYQEYEERPRTRSKRATRKKKKDNDYNWVDEALSLGWKPPGSTDFDWKSKAREKGWIPPNEQVLSSVGIECDPNARGLRNVVTVQTDPIRLEPDNAINFSEDDEDLIKILNPRQSKKRSDAVSPKKKPLKLQIAVPQIVFDEPSKGPKPKQELHRVPCLTLISEPPLQGSRVEDDLSSSEQQELHSQIQSIINMTHNGLANFQISSDEDEEEDEHALQHLSQVAHDMLSEESERETSEPGFFKSNGSSDGSSDPGLILRKIARDDPELLKMIELMDGK